MLGGSTALLFLGLPVAFSFLVINLIGAWLFLGGVPKRLAWYCEWASDALALACCIVMAFYGWKMAAASFAGGSLTIKTLVTPEWWLLAPLPIAFALLAIEVLFRMRRLYAGARGPRADAVSAG